MLDRMRRARDGLVGRVCGVLGLIVVGAACGAGADDRRDPTLDALPLVFGGVDPAAEADRVVASLAPAGLHPLRRVGEGDRWVAVSFRHRTDPTRSAVRVVTRRGVPVAFDADDGDGFVDLDVRPPGGAGPRVDLDGDGSVDPVLAARDASAVSQAHRSGGRRCLLSVLVTPEGFARPVPPPELGHRLPGRLCIEAFRAVGAGGDARPVGGWLVALPPPATAPAHVVWPLTGHGDAAAWGWPRDRRGLLPAPADRPGVAALATRMTADRRESLAAARAAGRPGDVLRLAIELALLFRLADPAGEDAAGNAGDDGAVEDAAGSDAGSDTGTIFDQAIADLDLGPAAARAVARLRAVLYDTPSVDGAGCPSPRDPADPATWATGAGAPADVPPCDGQEGQEERPEDPG